MMSADSIYLITLRRDARLSSCMLSTTGLSTYRFLALFIGPCSAMKLPIFDYLLFQSAILASSPG